MIRVSIKSENEKAVADSLQTTDGRVRFACAAGLSIGIQAAAGTAQRLYLSGPRPEVLDVRTTRLRQSIVTEVEVDGNNIIGRIGSNVPYAAFHEFGFFGTEQVRAHTRVRGWLGKSGRERKTTRAHYRNGVFQFAEDIRPESVRMGLSNFSSIEDVLAYTRKVAQPGKSFLRPALEATDILGIVKKEIAKVANG